MNRFSVFLITVFLLSAVCSGEIHLSFDIKAWGKARETCRKEASVGSCDLITDQRLGEEWSKLGVIGEERFWIGGRRFFQWLWDEDTGNKLRLFEEHGCYKHTVDASSLTRVEDNGPFQCYTACRKKPFVFLQGDSCYCADALEGILASRGKCDVRCDGSNDTCGASSDYFSVYSISPKFRFVDEDMSLTCAVGQIADNQLLIKSADCKRNYHYFCLSEKQNEEITLRSEQFNTAVTRCETRHDSSLPSLPSYQHAGQLVRDLQTLTDKVTTSSPAALTFWLPLRRHVQALWVDGQDGKEGGQFGDCIAVTPRSINYRLTDVPCTQSLGFMCECTTGVIPDKENKDSAKSKNNVVPIIVGCVIAVLIVAGSVLAVFFLKRWRASRSMN